jgi:uncharacterized damage-inducible protein DinB
MKSLPLLFILVIAILISDGFSKNFSGNIEELNSNFFNDLLAEMEYVSGQVLQLAEEMPEEKFSWRPSDEVRSVSEIFMHIGTGNYFILSFLGGSMPEGIKDADKKITKKSDVINFLMKSYEDSKNYVKELKDDVFEKPIDFFGMKTNGRRMLFILLYHNHEHLGQAIAYARFNNVTPPWSKKN